MNTDSAGTPSEIAYAGFGGDTGYYSTLDPGAWASGLITINTSSSYPSSFVMPYNGTVRNFYGVFTNRQELSLEKGVIIRPLMCLAIGETDRLAFRVLQDSIVYEDENATNEIIRDGWLHTGDIGYYDNNGYLYICGRKKNMLLVRGFNVYPEEIETCLLSCPLVKDCAVYGRADVPGNQCVCADIVPAEDKIPLKSIQNWCAVHLAEYKCPRDIRFVDKLNKTITGKNKGIQNRHAPHPVTGSADNPS